MTHLSKGFSVEEKSRCSVCSDFNTSCGHGDHKPYHICVVLHHIVPRRAVHDKGQVLCLFIIENLFSQFKNEF